MQASPYILVICNKGNLLENVIIVSQILEYAVPEDYDVIQEAVGLITLRGGV